jgi:DNA-binding HxlR family transcriptional regulator
MVKSKKKGETKCVSVEGVTDHPDGAAIRELMTLIGDKWSILLIVTLSKKPKRRARFSDLEKSIPAISERMLSLTLKQLEKDGFIKREVFPEVPPRVEYELTKLGMSLFEPMQGIIDWVTKNWNEVKKARVKAEIKTK